MQEIEFQVQGSAPQPYGVIFVRRSEANLSAYCSCPAGENGQYCKHRFAILEGSTKGIVSPNPEEVETVLSWLPGTDIEAALEKMRSLEKQMLEMQKELSAAKKEMARAMRD